MTDKTSEIKPLRSVILGALVMCLGIAIAPWMSGGQEPLAMLISGFALLMGAVLAWRQPEVRQLRRGPLVLSFAVLVGFALLSLLWSANRYSTVIWVAQWAMAALAFRLAYTVAGETRGREWMLRVYLASAAVFSIVGIWMYVTSSYDRLTGTFYWPNPAAAYLIPAILVAVDRLRVARRKLNYLWGAVTALFVAAFWLTDSRGATLVLGLVGSLYLLVARTSKAFWIKFVFSMAIGLGLSLVLVHVSTLVVRHSSKVAPGTRVAEVAAGESNSVRDRLSYLESGFEMWFAHPLGGTGAGTYGDVHPQYQQRVVSASTDAHNLYVQTLAELGIVGAMALAAVVLWLVSGTLRGMAAAPELLPVSLGGAALLLHFGLDIDTSYPALLMLAAVVFGLGYRQWRQGRSSVSWRWPAVAAVVLVPLISLYQSGVWADRGQAMQADGDYETAAADYGMAHAGLVYNPDYVNAEGIDLYTMATAGGTGAKVNTQLALDRAKEAENMDPHDGQHHQLEGRALALQGHLSEAQVAFRVALKLDPYDHPGYALDLASVQAQTGDTKGAVKTARAMLALYPPPVVANRNIDLTLRPTLADLQALVGNIALKDGDMAGAKAAAKSALALDPDNLRGRALAHQVNP